MADQDDLVCTYHIPPNRLQLLHQLLDSIERRIGFDLRIARASLIVIDHPAIISQEIEAAFEACAGVARPAMQNHNRRVPCRGTTLPVIELKASNLDGLCLSGAFTAGKIGWSDGIEPVVSIANQHNQDREADQQDNANRAYPQPYQRKGGTHGCSNRVCGKALRKCATKQTDWRIQSLGSTKQRSMR